MYSCIHDEESNMCLFINIKMLIDIKFIPGYFKLQQWVKPCSQGVSSSHEEETPWELGLRSYDAVVCSLWPTCEFALPVNLQ